MHRWWIISSLLVGVGATSARADFTLEERSATVAYWADTSRLAIEPVMNPTKGVLWVARQTVEGSTWLANLNRVRNQPKWASAPAANPWDTWIDARIKFDQWLATLQAASANGRLFSIIFAASATPPANPGLVPDDLAKAVGNPPRFYGIAVPLRYAVRFDESTPYVATDQVAVQVRSAYYRFPQGVRVAGVALKTLPAPEFDDLVAAAGISPSHAKVMRAVSMLEGGFESLNTYDTGFVSSGFLQFTAGPGGNGSLVSVLARMKADAADEFQSYFRRFGVDVSAAGVLQVIDPVTGAVLEGPAASQKVVDEKRLSTVFLRAGMLSRGYRVAQLSIARDRYMPTTDAVAVNVEGNTVAGTVADVVRSEAGMATLMDRKVHAGTLAPLATILQEMAATVKPKALGDLVPYEREIIERMRYRKDYLADTSLTQPEVPTTRLTSGPSRHGSRSRARRKQRLAHVNSSD